MLTIIAAKTHTTNTLKQNNKFIYWQIHHVNGQIQLSFNDKLTSAQELKLDDQIINR